jgi:hypothetical protein
MKLNLTVFKFSQTYIKKFYNSKDSKYVLSFSLALVVVEFLAILWFFAKWNLQNIIGNILKLWLVTVIFGSLKLYLWIKDQPQKKLVV